MKTKKFKQKLDGVEYLVTAEMDDDYVITVWLAEYLFLSNIADIKKRTNKLGIFYSSNGRLLDYDKSRLHKVKIVEIKRVTPPEPVKIFINEVSA